MSQIRKYSSLTSDHKYFLLDSLARNVMLEDVIDKFSKVFPGVSIGGDLIYKVGLEHSEELSKLKEEYALNFIDIPIANLRNQLSMLQNLFDQAVTPKVISVDRNGDPIEKQELEIARKCVELTNKILYQERVFKLKELEMNRYTIQTSDSRGDSELTPPQFQINVIHKKIDEDEDE